MFSALEKFTNGLLCLVSYILIFTTIVPTMTNVAVPELTFSSINCNSLNMSSAGKHNQTVKLYGVAKLKTDIIFMSDIRL